MTNSEALNWVDCPHCKAEGSVQIQGSDDFVLNEDGTIRQKINAWCVKCNKKWR